MKNDDRQNEDLDQEKDSVKGFKSSQGKMPDFIIMNDTQEFLHGTHSKSSSETPFRLPSIQNSFSLRLFCFFGTLLSFLVAIGMLIATVCVFLLAALLLFQHRVLNQYLSNFWSFYINSSVVALGLAIACLSPMLGLGLLLIYFSFKTDSVDGSLLKKIFRKSFDKNRHSGS